MVQYDTLQYFMILYVAVRMGCDIVQYDEFTIRCGTVRFCTVWYYTYNFIVSLN